MERSRLLTRRARVEDSLITWSVTLPVRGASNDTAIEVTESSMTDTTLELPGKESKANDLTESERHRILASEHRRTALDVLAMRTDPVDLSDIARSVAAQESTDEPDAETVERVATSLHHAHLPAIADVGLIDYDADANRVVSSPRRPRS